MKSGHPNTILIDGYVRLLNNLSPAGKLELISKLAFSLKKDIADRKILFYKAFGAWDSKKSAGEIIMEIRQSRTINRERQKF